MKKKLNGFTVSTAIIMATFIFNIYCTGPDQHVPPTPPLGNEAAITTNVTGNATNTPISNTTETAGTAVTTGEPQPATPSNEHGAVNTQPNVTAGAPTTPSSTPSSTTEANPAATPSNPTPSATTPSGTPEATPATSVTTTPSEMPTPATPSTPTEVVTPSGPAYPLEESAPEAKAAEVVPTHVGSNEGEKKEEKIEKQAETTHEVKSQGSAVTINVAGGQCPNEKGVTIQTKDGVEKALEDQSITLECKLVKKNNGKKVMQEEEATEEIKEEKLPKKPKVEQNAIDELQGKKKKEKDFESEADVEQEGSEASEGPSEEPEEDILESQL